MNCATTPDPDFSNKSLTELLASLTPMPGNSGNENCACHGDQSDFLSLFNNHGECNKTPSDQQPAMNASLINIVHLEAELAASRLLVEEHESEIKKLRTEKGAIKSELAGMKKLDTTQKSKLKKLTQDNDKLRRELSKYSGIRKFTIDTETQQATSEEMTKLKDELSVVQAKLHSLRDHVKTYASQMFDIVTDTSSNVTSNSGDLLDTAQAHPESAIAVNHGGEGCQNDMTQSNNVSLHDRFQVVGRGRRRVHVGPVIESTGDGATSTETRSISQSVASGQASSEGQDTAAPQEPPRVHRAVEQQHRRSYAKAVQERLPDTMVIGTSLVKGVGKRLRERDIDNTTYCFPGAQLPQIRNRLSKLIVPGKIPKNIVVQAGGNDIENHRTDLVVREFDKLIRTLTSQCPDSNIMLCKVPCRSPFPWLHDEIAKVNTFLANSFYGNKVTCIDLCPEFGPR